MVSHEDINDRLSHGEARFTTIDAKLTEITRLLEPLPEMQKDIAATKEIVEAWGAVKSVGKFVKWIGGIATAILAAWVILKAGVKALVL